MPRVYSNNFSTTLNGAITSTDTTLTLTSVTGLPTIGSGAYTYLTVTDGTNTEIIKGWNLSGSTINIYRAQEGTTAAAFADLSTVEIRTTAESFSDVLANDSSPELVGDLSVSNKKITGSDGTDFIQIPAGNVNIGTANVTRMDVGDSGVRFGNTGARITTIRDEDDMVSDSATSLATQQSIKAYVDSSTDVIAATTVTVSGSLEVPNSAAPTVNADGEIALDTTVTDWSHGIPKIYGGEELGILTAPIAQFSGMLGYEKLRYNATNDELELTHRYMRASRNTAQAIATSTFTKIQLTTEESDVYNEFDNATNYRYTPGIAGQYLFIASASLSSLAADKSMNILLYKNGSAITSMKTNQASGSSGGLYDIISTVVDMNGSTDYIELYLFHTDGSSQNTQGNASRNFLLGYLL